MATASHHNPAPSIALVFLALIGLGLWQTSGASAAVSNDELSGTLKSLIFSYNQLDSKLERHEHRERALGELMKKAMQSLLKGQKSLEPINGIFGRLDERVSQIETMLIAQEEKYNAQSDKFNQDIDHMFKWMRENDECSKKSVVAAKAIAAPALPNAFVEEQQKINKQLLEELKQLGASVNKLIESNKQSAEQSQQSFERLPKTEELVSKIEAKLQEQLRATEVTTVAPPKNNEQFEQQLMERLGSMSADLVQLRNITSQPPPPAPAPLLAPVGLNEKDKAYIQELNNETLNALAALKTETTAAQQKGLREAAEHLQQAEANIQADLKQLATDVGTLNEFNKQANDSQNKMNQGLESLDKFNSIIMTNSDLALETQHKIEFVTLQIVQQIGQLVENQIAELTGQMHSNFTALNDTVISTQVDTKRNVSESMETALEQVWHQITIMGSELNQNKKLLELMQTVHIGYVNATYSSMSGLSNKVDDTKKHMIDMDTNLNFLLGKLSLMSTEFANIKQDLANALDDLRNSFQLVQEQMPNSSSGKQNMDRSQYLTQVNLLEKRHAQRGQE